MILIPECTLCGKNTSKLFLTEVEGYTVEVCEECKKYGNFIGEVKPKQEMRLIKKKPIEYPGEVQEELKPYYGQLIMQTRQKMGLKRKEFSMKINEKESIIKRVESQQMTPDEKLQKKIENFLDIKLTEVYEKKKLNKGPTKPSLTLGDIVKIE